MNLDCLAGPAWKASRGTWTCAQQNRDERNGKGCKGGVDAVFGLISTRLGDGGKDETTGTKEKGEEEEEEGG